MAEKPQEAKAVSPAEERKPVSGGQEDHTQKFRPVITAPILLGELHLPSSETQTTIGAAGGATALPATPLGYIKIVINGTEVGIPYYPLS